MSVLSVESWASNILLSHKKKISVSVSKLKFKRVSSKEFPSKVNKESTFCF